MLNESFSVIFKHRENLNFYRNYGELHLVHFNEDYIQEDGSIDATAFTVPNGLSVLGIMLEGGKDNQTYDTSWFDVSLHITKLSSSYSKSTKI